MSEHQNPYQPPSDAGSTSELAGRLDWKRFARILGPWLLGTSLAGSIGNTVWVGRGLSPFGGLELLPRVVALSVVQTLGARAAVLSVSLALVTYAHRRPLPPDRYRGLLIPAFSSVPLVTVLAVAIMLLSSSLLSAFHFGLMPSAFWAALSTFTEPRDGVRGFLTACVYASLFGLLAAFGLPALSSRLSSLWAKLCVTLVFLMPAMKLVELVIPGL